METKINKSVYLQSESGIKTKSRQGQFSFGRWKQVLESIVLPLALFLLPFWNANEGVDYTDTGYSLNNYANYDALGTVWKLATYLGNCLGRFFMALPGGDTLLGMNMYTSLLISFMAVAAYFFCKKKVPAFWAFTGEVLAICLCWCPTVILYNYLTYVLQMAALLCLYHGLAGKQTKRGYLAAAGVFLGINVFVRFPNLTEAAFILFVWYAAWLISKDGYRGQEQTRQEERAELGAKATGFWRTAAAYTGVCLAGYLAGFLSLFAWVCLRYGLKDYLHMLTGMSSMEESGQRYSALGMLTGPFMDYMKGSKWLLLLIVYMLAGCALFLIWQGHLLWIKRILYVGGMVLVFRYFWGHEMFDLNYYSYGAMFWPTILVLVLSIAICIYRLVRPSGRGKYEERLLAALSLLIMIITPLGSNNRSYTAMNNLFLVLPFTLSWSAELGRDLGRLREKKLFSSVIFPARATMAVCGLFFAVQILLFGATFTFGDEQKRDAKIENNDILRKIRTNSQKAEVIESLTGYYHAYGNERELVCYGNIPAFPYYLEAGTAIGSAWPDLDTYAMYDYRADMEKLAEEADEGVYPIILIHAGLDEEDRAEEKFVLLQQFMEKNNYTLMEEMGDILVYDRR